MLSSISVFAQKTEPPEPPNNKNNFDGPGPPGLPINGGLSFLLIAGAVLGVYATRKKFMIYDF